MDVELEKSKKKRLSAFVHCNLNKPVDVNALAVIEAAIQRDRISGEAEEERANVGKGKTRKRITYGDTYHVNVCPDGSHGAPTMDHEVAEAALASKAAPGSSAAVVGTGTDTGAAGAPVVHGNAITDMFSQTGSYARRTSESRVTGQAATSTGDHNPGTGRNPGVAVAHLDLRQNTGRVTGASVNLRSYNGDNRFGDKDLTRPTGSATVTHFDAARESGSFTGARLPNGLPSSPGSHIARDSATAPNGGHSLDNVTSDAVKASPREIMKRELFGG